MRCVLYLIMIICFSGCGVFKKVHKEKTVDKIRSTISTKSDSIGITIDRSLIKIKEKLDTLVKIPGKTIHQNTQFNMDSLINGMTAVKNDLIDIRLHLNPITNTLSTTATLKPTQVPVFFDRETTKENDITQSGSKSGQSDEKLEEEHLNSSVDKQPKNSIWFTVLVWGVVAIVIFAVYRYFRR